MFKYFNKIIVLTVSLWWISQSCTLDAGEYPPAKFSDQPYYLKEVQGKDGPYKAFAYNEQNQLVSQTVFNERRDLTYAFEYNGKKQPEIMKVYFDDRHRITIFLKYDEDGKLVESKAYSYTLRSYLFTDRYEYDILGRMIKRVVTPGLMGVYTNVRYIWEGANVVEVVAELPEVTERFEYEYDNKLNPYIEVYRTIGFNHSESMPISKNNWSRLTYHHSDRKEAVVTKNKFSYFQPGYPYYRSSMVKDGTGLGAETGLTFVY